MMVEDHSTPVRVAIVTGAAQGIGEAIALRLADDGFDVAVAGRVHKRDQVEAVVKAIAAKGRRAIAVFGDVSVEADVAAIVENTVQELGGLDVMVANAGIVSVPGPCTDLVVEEWDKMMAVNTRSVMLCIKHAARQMIKQGRGGRIIGAASSSAKQGVSGYSAYAASKFAIRGLVQCAALELRDHNITVNAFAPGTIGTPMMTQHFKDLGIPSESIPPLAKPSVVAELVSYMVKSDAYYLTGQCIGVNGGTVLD